MSKMLYFRYFSRPTFIHFVSVHSAFSKSMSLQSFLRVTGNKQRDKFNITLSNYSEIYKTTRMECRQDSLQLTGMN